MISKLQMISSNKNLIYALLYRYFSLQATHALGFSDETRMLVEKNICSDGGPSPYCFDTPLRIILSIIQRVKVVFLTKLSFELKIFS